MDAYEATRIVFSRIQSLDPENAAKIMGVLLIQDHGEKEMIRLAFGPEALLHSIVLKARKELGLLPATPSATAASGPPSPLLLGRQNSSSRLLGGLAVSSTTSWDHPSVFSRSSRDADNVTGVGDDIHSADELVSPSNPAVASPFHGGGDLIDELQLQEQLSFLDDHASSSTQVSAPNTAHGLQISPKGGDFFYPDVAGERRSPSGGGEGMLLPYSMSGGGWGANGGHYRQSFSVADACLGSDPAGPGLGWRPCLYYARGYCKNGTSCRFLHGVPDDTAVATMAAAGGKMDPVVEQQCQELLLMSKSQRLGTASQLMASAFPYSPTGSVPASLSSSVKCTNFLLQQHNESQRSAAAAAALMLGGGDETLRFMGRSRMERTDFAANPGSRQIYLTFPADSTFREEDVSNYFSIYGPVQDVRIPYQQKRMFGFVTFVYPETVKLILAKGNPHFVCDARVLVKPYKEKGKVPDKYRKQQQQQQVERGDLSGCSTPTSLDSRDPFELSQLGLRMYSSSSSSSSSSSQEAILRRKLEEQQQAAELQQAIELQGRRFTGLHLLDLRTRNHITSTTTAAPTTTILTPTIAPASTDGKISSNQEEATSQVAEQQPGSSPHGVARLPAVNAAADKEESAGVVTPKDDACFQESLEHNLPDSPFASPTKASFAGDSVSNASSAEADLVAASFPQNNSSNRLITSTLFPATSTLDMASFNSCFFQMPRFPSGHGAVGL